jgi:hypothetical protein
MVAASGGKVASPPVAGFLLLGILAVLLATAGWFNPATERNAALPSSPEVLAYTARNHEPTGISKSHHQLMDLSWPMIFWRGL